MTSSILQIIIGWFITYKMPSILKAKGTQDKVIKLIGWLFIIAGVISFAHSLFAD
jgi:hypothetical protein